MIFIDTNYFLRFFLNDIQKQNLLARELFIAGSEGKIKLFSSEIVLFEVNWVLKSVYKKSQEERAIILDKLLELNFIEFGQRVALEKSVVLFRDSKFGLEDCYNLYYAKLRGAKQFKTFDVKLAKEFIKKI